MTYDIRAWLDRDGAPQLEIIDADSGRLRVAWDGSVQHPQAIKSLFRDLLLLSVRNRLTSQMRSSR